MQAILDLLNGNLDLTNIALAISTAVVPIGSVIDWHSNNGAVPTGWMLADGTTITDVRSPNVGKAVSNKISKIARGVTNQDLVTTPIAGGSDTVSLAHTHSGNTGSHTLLTAEMPTHSHGINDGGHQHRLSQNAIFQVGGSTPAVVPFNGALGDAFTTSVTTGISTQGNGSGGGHTHPISSDLSASQSVVQAYVGLVPIERIF